MNDNSPRKGLPPTSNPQRGGAPEPSSADLKAEIASLQQKVSDLERSDAFLRSILESEPNFIVIITPEGTLRFVNRVPSGQGVRLEDILGRSVYDFLLPESHEVARASFAHVLETGQPASYESTGVGPSGKLTYYETHAGPIFHNSQVKEILAIVTDVTRYKHTENKFRENQEKLQLAASSTGMGIWSFDLYNDSLNWDESLYSLFGVTSESAPTTYEGFLALVHPEDRERVRYSNKKIFDGHTGEVEFRVLLPGGEIRWVRSCGRVIFDEEGNLSQFLGGALDITAHKEAQRKVEESERRYRDLFEKAALSFWEEDVSELVALLEECREKGIRDMRAYLAENPGFLLRCMEGIKILNINEECVRLYGARSKEELMARWHETFTPQSKEVFAEEVAMLFDGGHIFHSEVVMQTLQRERLHILISVSFAEVASAQRFFVSMTNITARKEAEQKLELSERRYRDLFEKAAVALWEEDISQHNELLDECRAKGIQDLRPYLAENPAFLIRCMEGVKILSVNEESVRLFGARSKEELLARWHEVFTPESMEMFGESVSLLYEGARAFHAEVVMQTLQKEPLSVLVSISFSEARLSHKLLISFTDITQRKQAEQKLERILSQEQSTRRRATFLSETSKALAHSLDIKTTLKNLLQLTVPSLAELAFAELLDEDGGFGPSHLMVATATDPALEALVYKARERYPIKETHPFWEVLRTGQPMFFQPERDLPIDVITHDRAHEGMIARLSRRSSIIVPLFAGRQKLGALMVGTNERVYDAEDLALMDELGRRAAMAIDNARLYQEAQDAIRVRDEFLSIASHELKTPLTPMRLKLQSLLRLCQKDVPLLPGQTYPKLESANQQLDRLHRLVEELLDISRITVGKLQLEPEVLDLSALLREVLERFSEEMKKLGCPLRLKAPPTLLGHWDRLRLEQVLTNVISNAIKYGAGKPIEIRLEAEGVPGALRPNGGAKQPLARISVRDHGIGIEHADQERIFQRFERAVSERHYGGFGLGLWITRQIVEAMGGSISVASRPGEGSTFLVELPCFGEVTDRPR